MPIRNRDTALSLFKTMCEIRAFEQVASARYKNGDLPGFIHLSLGQEACAAGACATLRGDDYITSNHRGHGHCLAKGANPKLMLAELFAKARGYGKGRSGSMHIADVSAGVLGANGIVGQSMGLGVGAALSIQIRRQPGVVIALFGEGASGTGIAHEAMNMASIWRLPIIFFCEANKYAELSPFSTHVSIDNVADRACAYGFPGVTVDGEDVFAVYEVTNHAVALARSGGGPTLIEAKTVRWHGHYEGDPQTYKSEQERLNPKYFDPIAHLRDRVSEIEGLATEHLAEVEKAALEKIRAAELWAQALQNPDPEVLMEDVYAEESRHG